MNRVKELVKVPPHQSGAESERRMRIPRIDSFILFFAIMIFLPGVAWPTEDVSSFRSKMEKWVETRQILSEERAEWLVEKETLEATRDLLRRERDDLRQAIADFEAAGAGADGERNELLRRRAEYQRSGESLAVELVELEREIVAIAPQLPEPLRNRLELLLVQIPEDGTAAQRKGGASIGQRLMNVLGVLAQTEKWNSTATLVGETRPVGEGGQKVQIRTLYWGLGQAVYVDTQGKIAGIGRATPEGWEFVEDPALASSANLFLDIYEGNVDTIAFVPVPVSLD